MHLFSQVLGVKNIYHNNFFARKCPPYQIMHLKKYFEEEKENKLQIYKTMSTQHSRRSGIRLLSTYRMSGVQSSMKKSVY